MLLIWLLLLGGSQMLKAQDETVELELKQNRDAWVCGDEDRDKKFIISLSMGEVKGEDSLYAMQIWLRYNPEKVMFVNLLDKNTLAEFFEIKGFNVLDTGLFTGYAMTMGMNQATGNKPLIAFEVKYLKDCPDSVHINLDDIEFDISKSFWNRLNYKDKNLIVNIKTKETENSIVAVSFLQDSLYEFGSDSTADILVGLNTNNLARVDSLDFEIKFRQNEVFELTDIDLFGSGLSKLVIDSVLRIEEADTFKVIIRSHLLSGVLNESVLKLKCKQIRKEDATVRLDIKVSRVNDCSCATSFRGGRMYIVSQKDTATQIVIDDFEKENNDIDGYYDFLAGDFVMKSKRESMKEVILFDMMGRMLERVDIKGNKDYRISGQFYVEGIYILHIKLRNGQEINKVLIKN